MFLLPDGRLKIDVDLLCFPADLSIFPNLVYIATHHTRLRAMMMAGRTPSVLSTTSSQDDLVQDPIIFTPPSSIAACSLDQSDHEVQPSIACSNAANSTVQKCVGCLMVSVSTACRKQVSQVIADNRRKMQELWKKHSFSSPENAAKYRRAASDVREKYCHHVPFLNGVLLSFRPMETWH